MSISNITAFATTLHAYSFLEGNGVDRSDACYYINPAIERAHALISAKSMSPYEAWMRAMFRDVNDLSDCLGVSKAQALTYRKNPHLSPPCEQVLHFCEKLGVHPAWLQPGMGNEKTSYHYPVMEAMARLYMNPDTHAHDRDVCLKGFMAERKRFNDLLNGNSTRLAASFSKFALQHVKELNKDNSYARSLRFDFEHVSDTAKGDMRLAFDLHHDYLERRMVAAYEQLMTLEDIFSKKKNGMIELVKLLYGPLDAEGKLDSIADQMEKGRSSPKDMLRDWKYTRHNLLRRILPEAAENQGLDDKAKPRRAVECVTYPSSLHPDYELNMRRQGLSDVRVKGMFLRAMPDYLDARAEYNARFPVAENNMKCAEQAHTAFQKWRSDSVSDDRVMPLFKNYTLVEACLGPDGADVDAELQHAARIRKILHLPAQSAEKISSFALK